VSGDVFRLHPALTRYLRARPDARPDTEHVAAWQQGFVDVMATLADGAAVRPLHEQRGVFTILGASFEGRERWPKVPRSSITER